MVAMTTAVPLSPARAFATSPRVRAWLRAAVGAGILVALILEAGAAPFVRGLASISVPSVLAALLLTGAATTAAAWRWRVVARRLGLTLTWAQAVSAYYRSGFLNTVLPGGIVGDVHRAISHGRSVSQVAQASRAVAAERAAGQTVQIAVAAVVLVSLGMSAYAPAVGIAVLVIVVAAAAVIVAAAVSAHARRAVWRELGALRVAFGSVGVVVKVVLASLIVVAGHVGHLRGGLPRRRCRRATAAAGRRGGDRAARGIHPAQYRRVGTARRRGRLGVRHRGARRDDRARRIDGLRSARDDRRRTRRGRSGGIRISSSSRGSPRDCGGVVMSRPYTTLSCAMSLDGYLDGTAPRRIAMSNAADFDRVDQLRAESDAIMVGASTVRRDDPRLLVRSDQRRLMRLATGRTCSPAKVTVTASGDLPPHSPFFVEGDVEKIVYCPHDIARRLAGRLGTAATVVALGPRVTMTDVVEDLSARGIGRLMVEGGGQLHTQFLVDDLVDELQLAVAPFFVGETRAPRFVESGRFPWTPSRRATLAETRPVGDVVLLRYALSARFELTPSAPGLREIDAEPARGRATRP